MSRVLHQKLLEKRWEALRAKLEAHQHVLIHQGALVAKTTAAGRPVWAVRFVAEEEGRRAHRSVCVGHAPVLVERPRRLLADYRSLGELPRQMRVWSRMLAAACSTVRRVLRHSRRGARSIAVGTTFR